MRVDLTVAGNGAFPELVLKPLTAHGIAQHVLVESKLGLLVLHAVRAADLDLKLSNDGPVIVVTAVRNGAGRVGEALADRLKLAKRTAYVINASALAMRRGPRVARVMKGIDCSEALTGGVAGEALTIIIVLGSFGISKREAGTLASACVGVNQDTAKKGPSSE